MPIRRKAVVSLVLALLPLAAQADDSWSRGLDVGGGILYTHMQEMDGGHAIVTESGFLPQDHGRVFLQHHNLEFGFSFADALGSINYKGQSQDYKTLAMTPYNTTTDTAFLKAQFDAAITLKRWRLSAFGGYNAWLRTVAGSGSTSDSNEDYRWLSLGLGGSYRYPLRDKLDLIPEADLWANLRVRQAAQTGTYDTVHLQPGGRGAAQLSVAAAWTLDNKAEFRIRPFIQQYTFSHSETVLATRGGVPVVIQNGQNASHVGISQPEIRYLQGGVDAEYEMRF